MTTTANRLFPILFALLALLTLGGCQAYRDGEQRTVGELTDDVAIHAIVKRRLIADPDIGGRQIDVDVNQGVVTLRGRVGSETLRAKAVRLSGTVKGVLRVEDQLAIDPIPN